MTKWRFVNLVSMFLTLLTCLPFDVVICQLPDTPTYSPAFFKNIGIRLCQSKCIQSGFCRGFEYSVPTLNCHLSETDHDTTASETHYVFGTKDLAKVRAGACQLKTCPNMRCLETRTGKTECVKENRNLKQAYAESNTTLLEASMVGDVARVMFILSNGRAYINSRDRRKMTPVMHAASRGHKEVFDLLVREGANLSFFNSAQENILHLACMGGCVEIVKYILSHNIVHINSRDEDGLTPIMNAALCKRKDVFDLLVEKGANLLLVNENGETILHVACEGGHVEIVKYLMKHNIVDIESREMNGWTPLMQAANEGHKDVFDILVEAGADLSHVSDNGETILHVSYRSVEIVKYLLTHKIVDVDGQDTNGWTPLMRAAQRGHGDVFDVLVEARADLSQVNNNKETMLHVACKGGNVGIVKHLISHVSADINSRDVSGWTPVMRAAKNGHGDVFDVLVEAGADLSQVNNNKETILHVACKGGNVGIVKHLISHVSADTNSRDVKGWTPVMDAVHRGHMDVFNLFVEKGADLSKVSNKKKNILHVACEGRNIEIIKYLLKRDIVDIDHRDMNGLTPVMHAALRASKDVFDVLVKWGADLSLLSYDNNNILHLALLGDDFEIVKYLITHNSVDINSRNWKDCTPAMIAARLGHEAIFFLLVENGADLTITNNIGDNILNMACKGENVRIVKYVSTRHIVEGSYREDDPC